MSKFVIYTIYDSDEKVIFQGTTEECCAELGIQKKHFHSIVCKAQQGKYKKYSFAKEKPSREEYERGL